MSFVFRSVAFHQHADECGQVVDIHDTVLIHVSSADFGVEQNHVDEFGNVTDLHGAVMIHVACCAVINARHLDIGAQGVISAHGLAIATHLKDVLARLGKGDGLVIETPLVPYVCIIMPPAVVEVVPLG